MIIHLSIIEQLNNLYEIDDRDNDTFDEGTERTSSRSKNTILYIHIKVEYLSKCKGNI